MCFFYTTPIISEFDYNFFFLFQEQLAIALRENEELKKRSEDNLKSMCDELKQANKIIKKLHDSNQEQTQKVI